MLTRLRETLCMPNKYYSDVTNSVPQSMKESLNRYNSNRIQESLENDKVLKILKESKIDNAVITKVVNRLHENGLGNTQRIFRLPVSRYDNLNGNGRNYPEMLWYNVMNNQEDAWKQNVGLCDHPADDNDPGSLKNAAIVWLGMEIDKEHKIVFGIGSFVGPYGHLAQEIIDAGGKVGFSTSGFGELEPDNETVNPDTYQIERLADCVLNPSQSVYGDISDEANNGNIEYTKQVVTDGNGLHESINNKILKENDKMDKDIAVKSALSKVEEKELRKHINNYLKENVEISNPVKQLKDLKEIQTLIQEGQLNDLEDSVKARLDETQKKIEEMVEIGLKTKIKESEVAVETSDGTKVTVSGNEATVAPAPAPVEMPDVSTEDKDIGADDESKESIDDFNGDLGHLTPEQESLIRKYANSYFQENHSKENPFKVLEEATKILNTAKESKLDDLATLASIKINEYQESINKDAEAVLRMKEELKSDDIDQITESAKVLMANGKKLVEDTTKYKQLCEALAQKNSALVKEYQSMKLNVDLLESKSDAADIEKNQKIVALTEKIEELQDSYNKLDESAGDTVAKLEKKFKEELEEKNTKITELTESVKKYSHGNSVLEHTNGLLESKLKATEKKLENTKYELNEVLDKVEPLTKIKEDEKPVIVDTTKATDKCTEPKKPVEQPKEAANTEKDETKPVTESTTNDVAQKVLVEETEKITEYYNDLESRFGESIKPYKSYITGADKYREAQRRWLAVMDKVDTTFQEAINSAKVPTTEVKLSGLNRTMDLNKISESTNITKKFGLN